MELHEHRRSLGKHPASCVHSPSWSWVTATSSPIPSFPRWPQPGWLHFFLSPAKCYKGYFLQRSKHWRPEISSGFFIPSLVTATSLSVEVITCYIVDAEHIDMSCIPKSLIWRHKRRASLSLTHYFMTRSLSYENIQSDFTKILHSQMYPRSIVMSRRGR